MPNKTRKDVCSPCALDNLEAWFAAECERIPEGIEQQIVLELGRNIEYFVHWPKRAVLLWNGCYRPKNGEKHGYPAELVLLAQQRGVELDTWSNGPAIVAFEMADGTRPMRFARRTAWSTHHLYQKRFPYAGQRRSLHAVVSAKHFTQSAGLIAIHPAADALFEEYPCVAWLLRAKAFSRFGYDPDSVLSSGTHDDFGFADGHSTEVLYTGPPIFVTNSGASRKFKAISEQS